MSVKSMVPNTRGVTAPTNSSQVLPTFSEEVLFHLRSFFGCLAQFSAALIFFPTTPRTLLGLKVCSGLSAETLYLAKE